MGRWAPPQPSPSPCLAHLIDEGYPLGSNNSTQSPVGSPRMCAKEQTSRGLTAKSELR